MNIKNISIKDLAKEIYEDKRDYNEVVAFIGTNRKKELQDELSTLFGVPFIDTETPEGVQTLAAEFGV